MMIALLAAILNVRVVMQRDAHGGREAGEHADDDAELRGSTARRRSCAELRKPSRASPNICSPSSMRRLLPTGQVDEEQVLERAVHGGRGEHRVTSRRTAGTFHWAAKLFFPSYSKIMMNAKTKMSVDAMKCRNRRSTSP